MSKPTFFNAGSSTRTPQRQRLLIVLLVCLVALSLAGLATGAQGFALSSLLSYFESSHHQFIVEQIRAPRTLGAALVGGLLGLSGALAQGIFRNPLADPYLLGAAAGSHLAIILFLGGASAGATFLSFKLMVWPFELSMVLAAFGGALSGVALTLLLSVGATHTSRLLLCGVVVGVLLGALGDLITSLAPQILQGRQAFLLGSTSLLDWQSVGVLAGGLAALVPLGVHLAWVLDALTLGEDSAASLGIALSRMRMLLVLILAGATALAVAYAGLIAFVGLIAPHLVRRHAPGAHAWMLCCSTLMGAVLLLASDVFSRALIAPQELPIGIITAILGGGYLLFLLRKHNFA